MESLGGFLGGDQATAIVIGSGGNDADVAMYGGSDSQGRMRRTEWRTRSPTPPLAIAHNVFGWRRQIFSFLHT